MDYRSRRIEQRRHQRLGCFILVLAAFIGIVASYLIVLVATFTTLIAFIPFGSSFAFYTLAAIIGGVADRVLRRLFGYQRRKASLRHLKAPSHDEPHFPSLPPFAQSDDEDAVVDADVVEPLKGSGEPTDDDRANGRSKEVRLIFFPLSVASLLLVAAAGCSGNNPPSDSGEPSPAKVETMSGNIQITSSAFAEGDTIPQQHTGVGDNLSPPLAWSNLPEGTKSLALICDDPDAPSRAKPRPEGPWVHWVIYNLPADLSKLPAGMARDAELAAPAEARQGHNSWPSDNVGYLGPMPPPDSGPHRYRFKLYALDMILDLPAADADSDSLLKAMEGHILDRGQLMGIYEIK